MTFKAISSCQSSFINIGLMLLKFQLITLNEGGTEITPFFGPRDPVGVRGVVGEWIVRQTYYRRSIPLVTVIVAMSLI
jgi:hypothetical protein